LLINDRDWASQSSFKNSSINDGSAGSNSENPANIGYINEANRDNSSENP